MRTSCEASSTVQLDERVNSDDHMTRPKQAQNDKGADKHERIALPHADDSDDEPRRRATRKPLNDFPIFRVRLRLHFHARLHRDPAVGWSADAGAGDPEA